MQQESKSIRTKLEFYEIYLNRKIGRIQGAQAPGNSEDLEQLRAERLECLWLIGELHSRESRLSAQAGPQAPLPRFVICVFNSVFLIGVAMLHGWDLRTWLLCIGLTSLYHTINAALIKNSAGLRAPKSYFLPFIISNMVLLGILLVLSVFGWDCRGFIYITVRNILGMTVAEVIIQNSMRGHPWDYLWACVAALFFAGNIVDACVLWSTFVFNM